MVVMTSTQKHTGEAPGAGRRVGRPSIRGQRKEQIVSAFIGLVAERGLERVSLDDVAKSAGIQRPALRAFVGNRDELVRAAIAEITRVALADMNEERPLERVVTMLFNPNRMDNLSVEDRAWWELLAEAMRSPETRDAVKKCYDQLCRLIASALRQAYPHAPQSRIADTAYAIAIMAEYNYTFQRLGYPRARCLGLKNAALTLAAQLG